MEKKITVLFIWETDPRLKAHFKKTFRNKQNIRLIFPVKFDDGTLKKYAPEADIIIGWRPSEKLISKAVNLKLFINPGTGVKHHIENFRKLRNAGRNILLINGHGHAYATAQHAAAMLLALMNRIVYHHNQMTEGKWNTSDDKDTDYSSLLLRGRKIGLLGYGNINRHVHRFLSGFENEFHILKNSWKNEGKKFKGDFAKYEQKDLKKFLKASDILIIAIPHTEKTERLINRQELKLLGKNCLIVNVARGIIIDEKSFFESLKSGSIAGAAIDVWYNYRPEKNKEGKEYPYSFPFHKLKNVLLSPHRAASPFDNIDRWDEVTENIFRLAEGKEEFVNVVDLDKEY